MASITLKFKPQDDDNTLSNFNSSLQVNDYVYYVKTNAEGSYTVNYNDAILVGAVKTITPPVKNITIPVTIDRDHYTNFTRTSTGGTVGTGANSVSLNWTAEVDGASSVTIGSDVVKIGDLAIHSNIPANTTVASFKNIGSAAYAVLSDDLTSAISSESVTFRSPTYRQLKIPYTGDLSVGMFVRGASLSLTDGNSTTTISAINDNNTATINATAATSDGTHNFDFSIANTNTESIYYQVEVTTDLTLGDLMSKANSFFFFVKDTSVNTSGLLGYYADMKIELASNTTKAELFSVGTEMFESSK
tara:strand:- start:2076 stop:2987 length:912 start_codon:yes stop_codon:yes gene_type:complete